MLFDLKGKRRRVVQGTYLALAVLMGGGLVLFGIGGSASGGLFDALGGGGGGNGNSALKNRIDRNEKRATANPRDVVALKELVRDNYQLAGSKTDPSATGFPPEARKDLSAAGSAWERYLKAEKGKPDPSLATVAIQIFSPAGLNRAKPAQEAAAIIAEQENSSVGYIRLVQFATLAHDRRTADLAGKKAIDLAPKSQLKAVKAQVEQAKNPSVPGQGGGTSPPSG
jgi:hypothetical protein